MPDAVDSSEEIFKGKGLRLNHERVILKNGVRTEYDILIFPEASAIVPLIDRETVLLIRQYRHAVGGDIWEIPAGTFKADEKPLECAKRELTEETGYTASIWHHMGEIIPIPGHSNKRVQLFLAMNLKETEQNLDTDEIVRPEKVRFEDSIDMIIDGRIMDAKSICALFMAQHFLAVV
ncbi:MAG: NUDIX hydrolase [Deltaproteobacteria bacterium]|nr:NUDIX hydrolase [Deltaproteobacteria bacterium]